MRLSLNEFETVEHFSAAVSSSNAVTSTTQQGRGAICVTRDSNRGYYIRVTIGDVESQPSSSEMLTDAEMNLLSNLKTAEGQQRHTGRFLTLRKRRPRMWRRTSLSEVGHEQEVYQKQTMKFLSRVGRWDFNTFALDSVTAGRPLPILLLHLFQQYELIKIFQLDAIKVWKCFAMIEDGYHSKNPYHNAVHATDVTQAMHCFLQEPMILSTSSPMEIMTSLLAAVTHDLDHPGVNQPFLIATSNHLAFLYKNSSVLENHHWRSAVCCLIQSGMLDHLDRSQWDEITFQIRSLILATDITRQNEFLSTLKHYTMENLLDMTNSHYRHFILQIALKCADICNPCRTWDISSRWSRQVCEEFFRQGDVERQLNLPVTAFCDRSSTSIAKIQTGFIRFVVAPLFEAWNHLLQTPLSSSLISNLRTNQEKWENLVCEESKTAVLLPAVQSPENLLESKLDLSDLYAIDKASRRHSVPLNFLHNNLTEMTQSSSRSLYLSANWATSLSTLVQARCTNRDVCLPMGSSARRSSAAKILVRQTTFPPLQRLHVESRTTDVKDGDISKCTNNNCGSSSQSDDEIETTVVEQPLVISVTDDRRRCLDRDIRLFSAHRNFKPLVRLKSDSDLSRYSNATNGKMQHVIQLPANREEDEKENAEPALRTVLQSVRNCYRKNRSQGVSSICSRLSTRRSSAPVGVLKEELPSEFSRINTTLESEICQKRPLRRDSAPIVFIQNQASHGNRRSSLPADLLIDSDVPDRQLAAETDSLAPTASNVLHCGSNRFSNINFDKKNLNVRRQSMPGDFNAASRKLSHVFKVNELFSSPSNCLLNSGGREDRSRLNHLNLAYRCNSLKAEEGSNLVKLTKSFDSQTPVDENGGNGHKSIPNWLKDLSARKVLFPLYRRSSVPTEAWLFSSTSNFLTSDDQPSDLILDLKVK